MHCGRVLSKVSRLYNDESEADERTDDYDRFWSTASKLVPLPSSSRTPSPASDVAAPSTLADGRLPDASAMRSVPLRIYLPDNAPIIQDIVPPLLPNGMFPFFVLDVN